jgi:PIN domain nuclease of toxin-antitoxin system
MERNPRLGPRAKKLLLGKTTRPVVSAVSIWEISIKASIGRLEMADPLDVWVPRLQDEWGVYALHVTFEHAIGVRSLPHHHNDPFDRMLVAQARCENLTLVTVDPAIAAYDVPTVDARL